jgi:hypothetical protein
MCRNVRGPRRGGAIFLIRKYERGRVHEAHADYTSCTEAFWFEQLMMVPGGELNYHGVLKTRDLLICEHRSNR